MTDKKTNFEKVLEFNKAFGVETNTSTPDNLFTKYEKLLTLRKNLIKEEFDELVDSIEQKDLIEFRDAVADILYVTYGAATAVGLDADHAFDIVHKSNMSKLCLSEEEAKETVQDYLEKYKTKQSPYDSPTYRKSPDDKYWVVYNKSTNKILKSINYTPADLTNVNNFKDKY